MLIATRVLTLRSDGGDVEVPISMFAPEPGDRCWICRFEIDWPGESLKQYAAGEDAIQALELALNIIGALIYTSEFHKSGRLMWLEPGQGYGFPVAKSIRDLLIGHDKEFDGD
jgi:hypothetical protein